MSDRPDFFDELSSEALRSGGAVLDAVAAILEASESERLRVLELGAYMATLGAPSGKVIRVFRAPDEPAELQALVERVVEHNPKIGSELVIVGGSARHTEAIGAAIPELLMHPFVAFQRAENGTVRSFPDGKGLKSPRYSALARVRVLSEPERREVLVRIEEHARSLQNDQHERSRFFRSMSTRPPKATYALLVAIAFTYLLQLAWGPKAGQDGAEDVFFIAMGALFRPMVEDGEWWRMISVGFLHGNFMHLGVNSFVLYLLGGQTERVIGTSRFLILYTAALLGGSFASLYFGHGFSVGASGAVWGLLGAQVALAYGRPPVLPASIAESLKPMAKQNLLINVGISFLPGIDAAAHFGGGITGALVLASGVLYRSRSGVSEGAASQPARLVHGEPAFTPYVATVCVALLFGGLLAGVTTWQPWGVSEKLEERLEELLSAPQP